MIIAAFQIFGKLGHFWFFKETLLLTNISLEVVLGMPFLNLSNDNIKFAKKELFWRTYTIEKVLPIIC